MSVLQINNKTIATMVVDTKLTTKISINKRSMTLKEYLGFKEWIVSLGFNAPASKQEAYELYYK